MITTQSMTASLLLIPHIPPSSFMHTAIEYDPYSSMFYISSPIICSPEKDKSIIVMPDSALTAICEDKEMTSLSIWTCSSATEMSSPSWSCADSLPSFSARDGVDLHFRRSASPSPEPLDFACSLHYMKPRYSPHPKHVSPFRVQ